MLDVALVEENMNQIIIFCLWKDTVMQIENH